ncbi:hypothetical protein Leryth_003583 [Lithospermum erythrorhizon]|uniref:Uncharacterized protein n=1 Tax=Lithospermum erythrorhizon TaxID=34254 RepID=A0AAV3Q7I0_LITER|nr:hypothetical protein Leryth_003583 [Lithospermum erythrorhizon]
MPMEEGYYDNDFIMNIDEEEGCVTPRRSECKIPVRSTPPPPPRKKPCICSGGKRRQPPKNGYFHPPDLELLFAMPPRHQATWG